MRLPETASSIAADVAAGRIRAIDVCDAALERVARVDPSIGAFLETTPEAARAAATAVDQAVRDGKRPGALAGVPIAVKDNICTRCGHTTCASRMLAEYRSPYDATVIERILAAGGVIIGKTNLDEFAMGSSTENSARHPTRNPWATDRVSGGSSGGSAAAVAAGIVPLALGSDTGGSIRLPAALCGVTGLKPTYGRVSRYGLVAFGSSLDQIGPIATTAEDAALLLHVIAGHDPRDSTSAPHAVAGEAPAPLAAAPRDARGLRIGVPREYFGAGLDPAVGDAVQQALDVFRASGAETIDISLPHTEFAVAVYYVIATAEASSNLARFDGVHYGHRTPRPADLLELYCASRSEGFGAEVKRRIMLGTFALSSGYYDAYYDKALRVRRLIQRDFERAFAAVDIVACPASPTPAFPIGQKASDPLQMYLADVYTIAANLAGIPAVVTPCGLSPDGLPISLQLQGRLFGETPLLQAAQFFQSQTQWHRARPPVEAC